MKEEATLVKTYVGLDVSVLETHICVLDEGRNRLFRAAVLSEPDPIVEAIRCHAPNCERVTVETGATTPWLWRKLRHREIPIICIDARPANKALSMRFNKTDRNDAEGLAKLMRIGWFKEANVRTLEAQYIRSMLSTRYQLRLNRRNVMNQMRGIMTVPGVSYLVALGFMTAIDDPARFSWSNKVSPYLGLAPRVRRSGESGWCAGVGHSPSPMVRAYLYQAAAVMLTKTKSWSRLKAWGLRLVKRIGFNRAAIAVARKMAIIMHAIWEDGTEFEYGAAKAG